MLKLSGPKAEKGGVLKTTFLKQDAEQVKTPVLTRHPLNRETNFLVSAKTI